LSSKDVAGSSSKLDEYCLYQFFNRGKECIWPKPGHDLPSGMTSAGTNSDKTRSTI